MSSDYYILILSTVIFLTSTYILVKVFLCILRFNEYVKVDGEINCLSLKSISAGVAAGGTGAGGDDLLQIRIEYSFIFDGMVLIGEDVNVWDKAKIFSSLLIKNYDEELYSYLEKSYKDNDKILVWFDKIKKDTILTKKIYKMRLLFVLFCFSLSLFCMFYFGGFFWE